MGCLTVNSQNYTVIPSEADTGKTLDILIISKYYSFYSSNYSIQFDYRGIYVDITTNSVVRENDSTLRANITIGKDVYTREYCINILEDSEPFDVLVDIFHINGLPRPIIKSISPNKGAKLDTVEITVIGENTHFIQAAYNRFVVDNFHLFDSIFIFDMEVINDTLITLKYAVPSDASNGGHNVYLCNSIDDCMWLDFMSFIHGLRSLLQ
jgi:hypothetical protein